MADLDRMLAGVVMESGAHAFGVVDGERHRLFLIDMLATRDGGGEVFGVEVLRGGDEDGIDVAVVQQAAVVEVGLGVGRDLPDIFEAAGIDVGGGDAFHVLAVERLLEDFGAAGAGTDDAEADTLAGAERIAGRQRAGQAGGDVADEITARLHGDRLLGRNPNYIRTGCGRRWVGGGAADGFESAGIKWFHFVRVGRKNGFVWYFCFRRLTGGVLGSGMGMFLRLRYSTGRGWSPKWQLREVVGGEAV